jgi:hypothetical protein
MAAAKNAIDESTGTVSEATSASAEPTASKARGTEAAHGPTGAEVADTRPGNGPTGSESSSTCSPSPSDPTPDPSPPGEGSQTRESLNVPLSRRGGAGGGVCREGASRPAPRTTYRSLRLNFRIMREAFRGYLCCPGNQPLPQSFFRLYVVEILASRRF